MSLPLALYCPDPFSTLLAFPIGHPRPLPGRGTLAVPKRAFMGATQLGIAVAVTSGSQMLLVGCFFAVTLRWFSSGRLSRLDPIPPRR